MLLQEKLALKDFFFILCFPHYDIDQVVGNNNDLDGLVGFFNMAHVHFSGLKYLSVIPKIPCKLTILDL